MLFKETEVVLDFSTFQLQTNHQLGGFIELYSKESRLISAASTTGWAKVKDAAQYAGVGERTFRRWFKEGLRYSKTPTGAILIKLEWIDRFLEGFVVEVGRDDLDQFVDSVLDGLMPKKGNKRQWQ